MTVTTAPTPRTTLVLCLLALLAASGGPAWAADPGSAQGGALYSIEKRRLLGSHELSVSVGTLPMDAFGKGLTLRAVYTYHFNQLIAWEILGGTYSFVIGTGLKEELRDRFEVQPEEEGELQAFIDSDFVLKPLYGKIAWLNDTLLSAELFFAAGPALAFFDDQSRPFGGNAGAGVRFFLGQYFSLRLDVRDYLFISDVSDIRNHLYISLGLGLTFGFGDTGSEDEQ